MLVCHVSLRALRRTIAADLAEVAAALDASTTGQIIFATLVDDPASVRDTVNAYLGEIMVEAASAADTVTAGLAYAATIVETVTAAAIPDGTVTGVPTVRCAMVGSVFVNTGTSREAHLQNSIMINQ